MQKIINDASAQVEDPWTLIDSADADLTSAMAQAPVILPLQLWLDNSETLSGNQDVGVWLESDQQPDELKEHLQSIPLVAIHFPAFADGRGYSQARRLRLNFDYKGELRAFGDVLRDQLLFYKRCGFNSFCLRDDSDSENAVQGLNDFSVFYQDAADDIVPPFARH